VARPPALRPGERPCRHFCAACGTITADRVPNLTPVPAAPGQIASQRPAHRISPNLLISLPGSPFLPPHPRCQTCHPPTAGGRNRRNSLARRRR
jgi:hypothetical protein